MTKTVWKAVAILVAPAALAGIAACTRPAEPVTGRAIYQDYCVACHGDGGKGDGPAAAGLAKKPADLTRISARNGGTFPLVKVMSTIDGYTRRNDRGSKMPEMGPFFQEGPVVMVDTGQGVSTPTPERLVALAEYLRSLQR